MLPAKRLHEIFELRARAAPERVAISLNDEQLSYGELDARADRLARRLVGLGVGPDVLVGLCMERSVELIVGLLAIVKAGGAYVPVDPAYPDKRINFLLADSGVKTIVTTSPFAARLKGGAATVVCADDDHTSHTADAKPAPVAAGADNLAYIIYTSGSTGVPKGVCIEHRNVVRLFEQTSRWFHFSERDVWTMFHSVSFDFSVWEIWGALLYGGRLVIVPRDVTRSPPQLHALLRDERVTVLNQTPAAFRQLVAYEMSRPRSSDLKLRFVIFGGEALDLKLLEPWVARYGDQRPALVNMYGITETTIHVTYKRILRRDLERPEISPIGVPIPDLRLHLLDENGVPVADGTPGELYVAGDGLARGYLERPELTEQRFVRLPQAGTGETRLYRSGDRAVRMADGEYAYLNRSDEQLKVRGFRIEPREIELCLSGHPGVASAFITSHDYGDGDARLLAYVIPRLDLEQTETAAERLTAELSARAAAELPPHMRPSAHIILREIPTTAHGKIDREALRQLAESTKVVAGDVRPEMSPTERQVAEIWEEVLQRHGVGPEDEFSDLGGTSLALIRVLVSLNQRFGVALGAGLLAEVITVARMARRVDAELINNGARSSVEETAGAATGPAVFT